jgi:AcrR family transcriptional regulator
VPATTRPRRLPPDVRRDQILDAGERVLVRQGLRDATVALVAEEAGVAKGTMYLYFESKDELLAGLRARYLTRLAEATAPAAASTATDRLRAVIVGLFVFSAAHRDLHHVLFHEAGFSEADAFADLRDRVAALIADGVAAGELDVADVSLAASFVVHAVHGTLVHALHDRPRASARRVANAVADLVERALTA